MHRKMQRAKEAGSFTRAEIAAALEHYVEPDCAQDDPANETDLRRVAEVREPVMQVVDRFIKRGGERRHILLLADSGMGKTTFALNFLERESKKKDALGCVVIPLGRPNALDQVRKVKAAANKVLILDAFDEDADAQDGNNGRIQDLMSAASDFAAVIITCRSQFFHSDASIPNETGVSVIGPRRAGITSSYKFYRLYLLPFSERQVSRYLKKTFPIWSFLRRREARRLIREIPELTVRPMLLALIPELAKSRRKITELFDLYEFMVSQWADRESRWINKESLLETSQRLAVYMFCNETGRAKDRVSLSELQAIADDGQNAWRHFTSRSLLNRDSAGNYKFAHRSIAEYLFVVAAIKGEAKCFTRPWTDFMREVFVSWGNGHKSVVETERAREILAMDLRQTQLLPLAAPLQTPRVLSTVDLLKSFTSSRRDIKRRRPVPAAWRVNNLRVRRIDNVIHLYDFEYDLAWKIVQTLELGGPVEIDIYKHNIADLSKRFGDEVWRLPSSDEFMSLLEAENTLNIGTIIDRHHFYWLGDKLGKARMIVASLSESPSDERLRPFERRMGEDISSPVNLFEVRSVTAGKKRVPFSAMCIAVRRGAETLWHADNELLAAAASRASIAG